MLRALTDVVLVGAETVRVEDYRRPLGRGDLLRPSRRPGGAARPALAIWSRSGVLPTSIEVDQPTYLVTGSDVAEQAARRAGIPAEQVIVADTASQALQELAARGLRAVQAEGGPAALGRLAAAGLLDELCFSTSHRTVGGPASRVLRGAGTTRPGSSARCSSATTRRSPATDGAEGRSGTVEPSGTSERRTESGPAVPPHGAAAQSRSPIEPSSAGTAGSRTGTSTSPTEARRSSTRTR